MYTGYHFSVKDLKIGDLIISDQASALKFSKVKTVYAQVAKDLGIFYPEDESYGYSFPQEMLPYLDRYVDFGNRNGKVYVVQAPHDAVQYGNYDFSAYITAVKMNWASDFRSIRNLQERNKKIDEWLVKQAGNYFANAWKKSTEAISDQFKIVDAMDLKTFFESHA